MTPLPDLALIYKRYAPPVVRRLRDFHDEGKELRKHLRKVFVRYLETRETSEDPSLFHQLLSLAGQKTRTDENNKGENESEGFLLERYLAGETDEKERAEIARRSRLDPSIAKRLERLRHSNDEILGAYPPSLLLSEIKSEYWIVLSKKRGSIHAVPASKKVRSAIFIIAASLVLSFFGTWLWKNSQSSPERKTKAGPVGESANELFVFERIGLSEGEERPLKKGRPVEKGALLHVAYFTTNAAGVIFSVDPEGRLERLFPDPEKSVTTKKLRLIPNEKNYLPGSYELSGNPGRQTLYLVAGTSNLDYAEVWRGATKLAVSPMLSWKQTRAMFSNYDVSAFEIVRK